VQFDRATILEDVGLLLAKPKLNCAGFAGGPFSFESCGHGCFVQHGVMAFFSFGWRYIPDGLQKSSVIGPVDPFQGGEFHRLEAPPWSAPMDDLGLVEIVGCLGEDVVMAVADAFDRRLYASFREALESKFRDTP
jgi:hypothetical protein